MPPKKPPKKPKSPKRTRNIHLPVMLSEAERAMFESAAEHAGLPLSTWIRLVCTQVARGERKAAADL